MVSFSDVRSSMKTKNKTTQDNIKFSQFPIQPYYLGLFYYVKMLSFKDIFAHFHVLCWVATWYSV